MSRERMSISQAVEEAFKDVPDEMLDDYLETLRENWRQLPAAVGAAITRCVVLIALFELLIRGAIDKASVSGIEITDLSLVRIALPVIVAYYFYDIIVMAYTHLDFAAVHDALIRIRHEKTMETGLDYFLKPRQPSIVGAVFFQSTTRGLGHILARVGDAFFFLLLIGLVLFEYDAYYEQFVHFKGNSAWLWIAATLSLLFVLYGYLAVVTRPESSRA